MTALAAAGIICAIWAQSVCTSLSYDQCLFDLGVSRDAWLYIGIGCYVVSLSRNSAA